MTHEEIEQIISQDQHLRAPIETVAEHIFASRQTFGAAADITAAAIILPVTIFVVKEIGLPWLHEMKRYSDLWRLKFNKWIDQQYKKHGVDTDMVIRASKVLRKELEKITDEQAQQSWEKFAALLSNVQRFNDE